MVRIVHPLQHLLLSAALLMVLFAGCVSPEGSEGSGPVDTPRLKLDIGYACPPGDTVTLTNGLCVTTFTDPRETLEEPYVAVHPNRPEIMAVGMNAWHADPRPTLREGIPSVEIGRVTLFVTDDGGATWERRESPPILYGTDRVGKTAYSGDPVVEFDADGVLHYLQTSVSFDDMVRPQGQEELPYIEIQYARSEDLGATWSKNMLLADDGDNDRPWMTVGPNGELFVTWRNTVAELKPPELAISTDGGTTWETFLAPPRCTEGDRALVHEGDVLIGCTLRDEEEDHTVEIHRFDLGTRGFEAVGRVPTPEGWESGGWAVPQWDVSPNGSVVGLAMRQDGPGGFVTFSRDGGANWTDPLPFLDLCACDPGTGALYAYGARFDASGNFHFLVLDSRTKTPDHAGEGNVRYATGEQEVFHLVVDAAGDPLHTQSLRTPLDEDARVPPSAGPPIGRDDYYNPAFWSDGGAVAWTRDKGIDLTHVKVDTGASGTS